MQFMAVVVGEEKIKSVKTDASLYNGQPTTNRVKKPSSLGLCRGAKEEGNCQPTGTGTMCHSVGVTSSMPPSKKKRMGFLENIHTNSKQCFALRVSYGRLLKAKNIIDALNMEYYVPMHYRMVTKHGKNHKPLNYQRKQDYYG